MARMVQPEGHLRGRQSAGPGTERCDVCQMLGRRDRDENQGWKCEVNLHEGEVWMES